MTELRYYFPQVVNTLFKNNLYLCHKLLIYSE